jgi:hypothetical protein
LELLPRGRARHIANVGDTRASDADARVRDHVPEIGHGGSEEATLGWLHPEKGAVQAPKNFSQMDCVFSQRLREDDNVVNVHAYIGQIAQEVRHDPLELASEGFESKGTAAEAVLDQVPCETKEITVRRQHLKLVE